MANSKYKKRADGRYCTTVVIGYTKEGNPKRKNIYGKTVKELEKSKRDFMNLYEKGVTIDAQNITLNEFVDSWLKDKKDELAESTYRNYFVLLNHVKNSDMARMKIIDIRPFNINRFLETFKSENKASTAYRLKKILSSVFRAAISQDIIYKNPCDSVKAKYEPKSKRALTEIEKRKIEKSNLKLRDKALVYTLRYTGIRRGELLALEKDDIDFKNKTITISKKVNDNGGHPVTESKTKTRAGMRVIPLFSPLATVLSEYMAAIDTPHLFYNKNNKPMSNPSFRHCIERLKSEIGLPDDVTAHTFRHTFVSECYEAGIDIARLQKWVGHDDIQTTLGIYTHLSKERVLDGSDMNDFYVVKMSSNANSVKTKNVKAL